MKNDLTSLYWASSSFMEPATCFMDLVWAAEPTLDTDRPTLMAGLIPGENLISLEF